MNDESLPELFDVSLLNEMPEEELFKLHVQLKSLASHIWQTRLPLQRPLTKLNPEQERLHGMAQAYGIAAAMVLEVIRSRYVSAEGTIII